MKSSLVIPVASFAILAAVVTCHFAARSVPSQNPAASPGAVGSQSNSSAGEIRIFEQAFWKRPTAHDRILHAERREWEGQSGVRKWQWFIVIEPSPVLLKYLREDNAFNLVPGPTPAQIEGAPEWFTFDSGEMNTIRAPGGGMTLIFSKSTNTLYATDSGGIIPGAPEPEKTASQSANTGRLPPTPPPNPLTQ